MSAPDLVIVFGGMARSRATLVRALVRDPMRRPPRPAILRMLDRINRDPGELIAPALGHCWVWTGARSADGYGILRGDRDPATGRYPLIYAHRLALTLALGRAIADGMVACHRCFFRGCVRPSHLYEGTIADNNADVWVVRRRPKNYETLSLALADV